MTAGLTSHGQNRGRVFGFSVLAGREFGLQMTLTSRHFRKTEYPTPATRKPRERLAQRILQGLEEGLAFCRGEISLKATVFLDGPPPMTAAGITRLRERLQVSQLVFAQMLNVAPRTVQDWERGLRTPAQSSLRLLQVIDQRPEVVAEVIGLPEGRAVQQSAKKMRQPSKHRAVLT